jgi:hypothetical protein
LDDAGGHGERNREEEKDSHRWPLSEDDGEGCHFVETISR